MSEEAKLYDERVRLRAYELWEKDGRPHGHNDAYWQEALRQIKARDRDANSPLPEQRRPIRAE